MEKTILAAATAIVATGALGAVEPAVRPGLWEVKLVRQYMDGRDVTVLVPAALAGMQAFMGGMSPQQRRQVEATLGKPPENTTQRICISPGMAAGDKLLLPAEVRCQPSTFKRDATRVTFEFSCADRNGTTAGKGESILASERVSTRIDMVTNNANGKHTWQNETSAAYIGADCGNLKPADQVMDEAQKQ